MKEKDLIIECAILNGWTPVSNKDITIHRAKSIHGKDLGEWWIHQSEVTFVRRVTDDELKSYIRDIKLKRIGV